MVSSDDSWEQPNITMVAAEDERKPAVEAYLDHPDVGVLPDGLPSLGRIGVYPRIGSVADPPLSVQPIPLYLFPTSKGYSHTVDRVRKAAAPTVKNKLNIKDDDQLSFATRFSSVIVDRQDQVEIKGHGTADRMF